MEFNQDKFDHSDSNHPQEYLEEQIHEQTRRISMIKLQSKLVLMGGIAMEAFLSTTPNLADASLNRLRIGLLTVIGLITATYTVGSAIDVKIAQHDISELEEGLYGSNYKDTKS